MTELLHLSALLPAAVGACCTVGGRRGSRVLSGFEAIAAVVMLTAMADAALGLGLVAPILWVAGLVALALVGLPLGRVSTAGSPVGEVNASAALSGRPNRGAARAARLDGSTRTIAQGPLLLSGPAQVAMRVPPWGGPARPTAYDPRRSSPTGPAAHAPLLHSSLGLIVMAGLLALMAAGHTASVSGHHVGGGLLSVLVLGGSAVYVGYSVWRAVTLYRAPVRNLLGCLEAASMAASVALMAGALAV